MPAKIKGSVSIDVPDNFFPLFKKKALIRANKLNDKLANFAVKRAKEIITKQQYAWKELSISYLRWKKKEGLDERIYIATRDLLDNGIGKYKRDGFIFVGPREGIHLPSELDYVTLCRILEFGTDTIPARPLWRPLLAELLKKRKALRKEYKKGLKKDLADATAKKRKKKSKKF